MWSNCTFFQDWMCLAFHRLIKNSNASSTLWFLCNFWYSLHFQSLSSRLYAVIIHVFLANKSCGFIAFFMKSKLFILVNDLFHTVAIGITLIMLRITTLRGRLKCYFTTFFGGFYFFLTCLCLLLSNRNLDLKKPIYQKACVYGHFKPGFTWEDPKPLVYKSDSGNVWEKLQPWSRQNWFNLQLILNKA